MEMRSPLARARGLGPSKEGGTSHWWAERMTAIALVPLVIWFIISALTMVGADLAEFKDWLRGPGNPVLLILLTIAMYHHGQLALQVIIEDYIHHEVVHFTALIGVKMGAFALAVYTIYSITLLAFGS
ncbi:MAG: succinate dehydrogenase, hydrophobic membrane anchor protein [Alphaproteobacteria bacterium]|jgi:succinate dehydrogenase / fumarate reductase, membrane anchor subunit|nr:succinate dehydrogenase, hydrophobic membrane anchor protein [Alphaproteobacteria bacterium]MBT7942293.1 succinate dehydrogenase, hydrophobic membrane anchor protein [Alphaproteobacteria bacterium]